MNKKEFLQQLEQGLTGINPEERVAALQYYTEYLDEAGPEQEAAVLAELGSPQKVAEDVKAASGEQDGWTPPVNDSKKTATEQDSDSDNNPELILHPEPPIAEETPNNQAGSPADKTAQNGWNQQQAGNFSPPVPPQGQYGAGGYYQPQGAYAQAAPQQNGKTLIQIILICFLVLMAPAIFGLFISAAVLLMVPFIMGVTMVPAGLLAVIMGTVFMPVSVGSGLISIGVGLFVAGIGLLCLYGGVWLIKKGIPSLWRACKNLFHSVFN